MPRELRGSIEKRGDVFDASVPAAKGSTKRVTCTFPTEEAAEQWKAEQIERLNRGLSAVAAPVQGRLRRNAPRGGRRAAHLGPDLLAVAERMVRQDYAILRKGSPDRATAVLSIARLHLAPIFEGRIPYDAEAASARVVEWVVASAGRSLAAEDLPERHRLGLKPIPVVARPVAKSTMTERLRVLLLSAALFDDHRVVCRHRR